MAHLLLACPKCRAAYKIPKEHAHTEVACRSCGHRWVPVPLGSAEEQPAQQSQAAPPAPPAPPAASSPAPGPAPVVPKPPAPLSALEALAQAAAAARPGAPLKPSAPAADRSAKTAPSGRPGGGAAGAAISALEALARGSDGKAAAAPVRSEPAPVAAAAAPAGPAAEAAPAPEAPPPPKAERPDPLVGTTINGFKVISRIGSGGFGVVYKAFDTNLERSVALKMLPPKIARGDQALLERFLREARSAAKLAHQNIVTIHQICPYKDTYYIVMELVEGGALHEYLAQHKRLSPAEATRIIRAAAEGLGHAHKRGIIHRDVKPGNIMMTSDGQVKVSDFGLARDVLQGRDIVGAGHSLGTPRYMAPEQALGEEPTAASDLYSLAATYFALLTGRAPFDASTDREIMKKHVTSPVPDPRQFVPDLPVAVYRFFEKAMAKEPEDRYMTAEDFIAALDRLDFSQSEASASPPEALVAQLGALSPEDRGSHLTETLGRAVRRAQRQRTPLPERAVDDLLGASTVAGRRPGWKLWLVLGIVVAVLVGGAVVGAILLTPKPPPEPQVGPTTPAAEVPAPGTPAAPSQPDQPAAPAQPGEQPARPPAITTSNYALESAAQTALKEAREYEAQPNTPPEEAIRVYQENVIDVYPQSRAAEEAKKAIERIRSGKPPEKPSETPTPPAAPSSAPPAEKPADK